MQRSHSVGASSRTLRDSTRLVSTQLAVSFFSLGYFALITHLFSKLDISVLAVVGILNAVGANVGGMGLMTLALQRMPSLRAAHCHDEAACLLGSCLTYSMAGATIVAVVIAAASRPLSLVFFKTETTSDLIVAAAWLLISYKAYESVYLSMQALDNFRLVSRMRLFNDIGLRLIALPGYMFGGILGYMFVLAGGQLTAAAIVIALKRHQVRMDAFFNWRSAGHQVRESLPFFGHGVVRFGTAQADSLLIGILLYPEALATYYVIRRFYDYLIQFYEAMLIPLIPKVAERRGDDHAIVVDAFRKSSRYFLAICLFIALLFVPLSSQLLFVFGGSKYLGGLDGLRLLFVAAILYGVYSFHSSFILALAQPRDSLINEIIMSLVTLGLSIWMVASYNVTGGAAARAAATAIAAITSFWILSRSLSVKLSHDWGLLKRLLPVSFFGAGAIILAQVWVQTLTGVFLAWAGVLLLQFYLVIRANFNEVDFLVNSLQLQRWPITQRILRLLRNPC